MAQGTCPECDLYDLASHAWLDFDFNISKTTEACRLLDGERAGCDACALVVSAIGAWQPGWLTGANQTKLKVESLEASLSVMLWPDTDDKKELLVYLHTDSARDPTGKTNFGRRRAVVADTRTQAAADWIALWLSDCVANHAGCAVASLVTDPEVTEKDKIMQAAANSVFTSTFMPRRILDLERGGRPGSDDRVWLVEELPDAVPYAALSYCWGSDLNGVLQTVRSNLQSHIQNGIPIASLSKTIQDAVSVCRRISRSQNSDGHCRIRYLWIDALCIVQDDVADWQQEASTMRSVYQSSHVTLVARVAASCHQGFLGPQMLGQPSRQAVWDWTPQSGTHTQAKMILRVEDKESLDNEIRKQPLEMRAWTLQEIVLPRRLVHFSGNEMYWECQTARVAEGGYSGRDLRGDWCSDWLFKTELQSELRQTVLVSPAENATSEHTERNERTEYLPHEANCSGWMALVEKYSRRQLTKPADKLVAIDGLAQTAGIVGEWARATPGSDTLYVYAPGVAMAAAAKTYSHSQAYVCGLFRSHLVRQLLWSADAHVQGTGAGTRSPQLQAPSWSWASVQAAVQYRNRHNSSKEFEALVTVDDIELNVNAYGRTESAALLVTGYTVFVAVRTAVFPFKTATMSILSPSDRRKDRISVVRPVGGTSFEVSYDDTGPGHVPGLAASDPGYACWVGTQRRQTFERRRLEMRMPESVKNSNSTEAVRDYGTRHGIPPQVGCQFPPDSASSQPKLKSKWCPSCAVPAPQEEYCCLRIMQQAYLKDTAGYYLVLRRSPRVPGAWQRVGIGHYIKRTVGEELFNGQQRTSLRII
ncbi:heterokaryon incompatibility protein [Ophiostoma piceae UAMH 11346]|uniref:Heterokaryon incompatibility protein n=1 Tax=Ophiostoma piceae (strain UAMH 11346) TaxID=1262450 RepID=S3BY27_OPHP1|nr:heterokaryon incompatibility protein [Ophiostoma piceae UAMH 11346]